MKPYNTLTTQRFPHNKATLILALVLTTLLISSLVVGTESITLNHILQLISHHDSTTSFILQLRLHRELTALLCGGMLGIGSAILQGITRNVMVAPDLTGMTSIGCLFIILGAFFIGKSPIITLTLGTLGAALGFILCYSLTHKQKGKSSLTIVLTGISLSFSATALTQVILLRSSHDLDDFLYFLSGSLYATTYHTCIITLIAGLILIPISLLLSKRFQVLYLDDKTCQSIGAPIKTLQFISFLIASLLIGTSICGIGNMGFLGIVAPNISRLIVGNRPYYLFILSFLIGATLYLLADIIGRIIVSPAEIPAGITSNMISAPLFLYILYRHFRGQNAWD